MTETTQAAVDATVTEAKPSVQVNDAQTKGDDLDALLKEFTTQTAKPEPSQAATETVTPQQPKVDDERLRRLENRLFEEDLSKATKTVFEGINLSERAKRGWLDQIARERPEIAQAFANQHNDPQRWNRIQGALAKEAVKEFKSDVDIAVTEDVAAVAQAVRSASTKAPAEQAPNFATMSDAEFNKWKIDNGMMS